ncbi:MAG: hypothetical protein HFJ17_03840 [Clostridia bacterium]|nr:hypothetical protein [Clostridia bacterium]
MEYIKKLFKKSGWISIIESVVFAILGLILIYEPDGTLNWISNILGAIFIIVGIYKIINYFLSKGENEIYNHEMIYGLMAVIIGIITIKYSTTIASIFRIIIGVWIIYSSLIRINLSLKLKGMDINVWLYSLILAIIMFICGLYIIMNAGTIIMTIGMVMVISSIIDIIEDVIFMKNVKDIF